MQVKLSVDSQPRIYPAVNDKLHSCVLPHFCNCFWFGFFLFVLIVLWRVVLFICFCQNLLAFSSFRNCKTVSTGKIICILSTKIRFLDRADLNTVYLYFFTLKENKIKEALSPNPLKEGSNHCFQTVY